MTGVSVNVFATLVASVIVAWVLCGVCDLIILVWRIKRTKAEIARLQRTIDRTVEDIAARIRQTP